MSAPESRTTDKPTQQRRHEARRHVLKGAHITFKGHWAAIDCTIRSLSDGGACLKVESPIGIPDIFDLVCDHTSSARRCRVIWRKATQKSQQIGVEFA
jgi:hypothetical protein